MAILSVLFTVAYYLLQSLTLVRGQGSVELSFSQWCILQNKSYSDQEVSYKEHVFNQNVQLVKLLNKQYEGREITFRLNQFADMTTAEFKAKVLTKQSNAPWFPPEVYATTSPFSTTLPNAFNWRDKGVVSDVKDQGSVGSCWAFSTVGNIEGQWALSGHSLVSLSAELLVDCDASTDPNNMNADCGVFGGWPYLAYQYIMKAVSTQ